MRDQVKPVSPRVGLLMAARDQADLLPTAIDSLLTQIYTQFTLTIVDDGSSDDTAAVLARYADNPRVLVIRTNGIGYMQALDLAMAKGKPASLYSVVFASAFYAPQYLSRIMSVLQPQVKLAGVYARWCVGNFEGDRIFKEPTYRYSELLDRNIIGPALIFRAEAFKQGAGSFAAFAHQGLWGVWRKIGATRPFFQINMVPIRYRGHPYECLDRPLQPAAQADASAWMRLRCYLSASVPNEVRMLLRKANHILLDVPESPLDVILFGSLNELYTVAELAHRHQATPVFVTQEPYDFRNLAHYSKGLLRSLPILTANEDILPLLAQTRYAPKPLLYRPEMSGRELTEMLLRLPRVLQQESVVTVVRAINHPRLLEATLESIFSLDLPYQSLSLLLLCPEPTAELQRWLSRHPYTALIPDRLDYFPQLLANIKPLPGHLLMGIDSGVVLSKDWLHRCKRYLWNPHIGVVSSFLHNGDLPMQHLPFPARNLTELEAQWQDFRQGLNPLAEEVEYVGDALFLAKKDLFEHALSLAPTALPLANPASLSFLFKSLGYHRLMVKETVGFQLF